MKIHINPKNKGKLHAELGVPASKKIPVAKLESAAAKGGIEAKRARFTLNARTFKH